MSRSVVVVLTVTLFTFVAGTAAVGRMAHAREAAIGLLAPLPVPVDIDCRTPPRSVPITEPVDMPLDLYGNQVSSAVASYTYDRSGGLLYEEHSPRTEVPRLTPPTS